MSGNVIRLLRWGISATFCILGVSCLLMVESGGDMYPLILAVFSFGVSFILYKRSKALNRTIPFVSAVVIVAASVAAHNVFIDMPLFLTGSEKFTWIVWNLMLGIPVMYYTYRHYG